MAHTVREYGAASSSAILTAFGQALSVEQVVVDGIQHARRSR